MKTLKRDGINGKLLLETLAYIETHPEEWNQEQWRCQTGMCFAGHAALTAGGARPLVPLTKELKKIIDKPWTDRSIEERDKVDEFNDFADFVRPEPGGDEPLHPLDLRGRTVKAVTIQDRARTLLGGNAVRRSGYNLFSGRNRLPSIRTHVRNVLEISEDELGVQLRKIAKRNGWEFPERSKWARG